MASIGPGADRQPPGALSGARGHGIESSYPTHFLDKPGLPATVVIEMPHAHSVVVEAFVRAGSAYETREQNGISHFLEHVVLAGTERYPTRTDLQRAIDATGGFLDAVTHKELTQFTFQVLPGSAAAAIGLLGEALARANFSREAVESEREIVLEEMITGNYEGAKDPFTEILWGTDSVGLPIIGTREAVKAITALDLRAFWRRAYAVENMLLTVAGRTDVAAVEKALESFRGAPGGGVLLRPQPARRQERAEFYLDRYGSGSIDACLMIRTPGWEAADSRLHTVLYLLTQYYQTHVYEELIGPQLPVYYLYAGRETFIPEGYIYFYFNVSRNRFFSTLERVIGEIDRIREQGISEEDLAVEKRRFTLGVMADLEDPRDVSHRVGSDLLLCGRERALSVEQELSQIESVTAGDLQALVKQVFHARNLCVVARGSLSWWKQRKLRKRLEGWLP